MAQTGYTPISIYYSSTAGNTPTAGNLVAGELAINTADGKLFYKDSAGVVQVIGTKGGVGSSTTTQVLYNSSGLVVGSANMTFNGTTLTLANDASISGLTVGKGGGSAANTTVVGSGAVAASNTGDYLTAVGFQALKSNTSGQFNNAVGYNALQSNTTGSSNNALGLGALNSNTTGGSNTAVGQSALNQNTTASYNTAVGYQAGYSNTTGYSNTFTGYQAGYANSTGINLAAFGLKALYSNTTGGYNTAIGGAEGTTGFGSLQFNTTGSSNTALGAGALAQNTTASNNTAVGYQAGYSETTGADNSTFGKKAGYSLTTPNQNTLIGSEAGYFITTGANNTVLGRYNGNQGGLDIRTLSNYIVLSDGDGNPRIITNPSGNTLFGSSVFLGSRYSQVGIDLNGRDDALFIQNYGNGLGWGITFRPSASASGGNGDVINFTNTSFTQVGKITTTSSATAYATSSDYRLKENVAPMKGALKTIEKLKPVTFTWKADGKDGQGFIAHELQAIVPDAVSGEKDALDKDGNPNYQGVDASFLVATLTAAIQELKAEVDSLKQQLGK